MSRTHLAFTALFFITQSCSPQKQKERTSFVFDDENIFSPTQINQFDTLLKGHERRTSNEIVIVTTADYGIDTSILFYSVNFLRNNNIGKENLNNGTVIVFSSAKKEVRIGTGYGTEKVLDDLKSKRIIDSIMLPQFRKGAYFSGLWNGSKAVVDFLEKPENKIDKEIPR
jgi:uncharacterized protein